MTFRVQELAETSFWLRILASKAIIPRIMLEPRRGQTEGKSIWANPYLWVLVAFFASSPFLSKTITFNVIMIGLVALVGVYQIGKQSFSTDNPVRQALFLAGAALLAFETVFVMIFCFKQLYLKGLL